MVTTTVALALVVATLVACTALGVLYARTGEGSVEGLLTARNSTGPRRTTATLVASVMGVWILFSAPEAGAGFGIAAVVGYAVGQGVPMLAYARLAPRIRELVPDGHSLTEYARARYGTAMYAFVLAVSALYMFVFLAAELTGIASALSLVAGVPQYQTAVLVGGFVLAYTAYGGLRASLFTDAVQALFVLPLLALTALAAVLALGGPGTIVSGVRSTNPTLLDPGFLPGLQFGLGLALAILGAELVNQTWWQRIYAAESSETAADGFRTAAGINAALVFVAALFGVVAVGHADVVTDVANAGYNADVAFFVLLQGAFPEWLVLAVVLLALLLVMSSVDSLFNALASLVTVDVARLRPEASDRRLALAARAFTVFVALAAIYVSLRARSVLRLFFLADLLGAAVAVPLVAGLYSRTLTGRGALASSLAGLAVGLAYFPDLRGYVTAVPVIGDLVPAADPLYLTSFAGAFLVSGVLAVAFARLSTTSVDLDALSSTGVRFDEAATDGGVGVETEPDE